MVAFHRYRIIHSTTLRDSCFQSRKDPSAFRLRILVFLNCWLRKHSYRQPNLWKLQDSQEHAERLVLILISLTMAWAERSLRPMHTVTETSRSEKQYSRD